nr:MAG TPA: hypothetical protein [Crassvirales sp.]
MRGNGYSYKMKSFCKFYREVNKNISKFSWVKTHIAH